MIIRILQRGHSCLEDCGNDNNGEEMDGDWKGSVSYRAPHEFASVCKDANTQPPVAGWAAVMGHSVQCSPAGIGHGHGTLGVGTKISFTGPMAGTK